MTDRHDHRTDDPVAMVAAINELTDREVSTVTMVHSNPDFDGPDELVICRGYWTNEQDLHFGADTRIEALQLAVESKRAYDDGD